MNDSNPDSELPPDVMQRALSEIMRQRGSVRSEKKAASSAENGKLGVRPARPLSEIPCTCSAGDSLTGHPSTCPRGLAIRRRRPRK